jgi:hypothetical protein
MSTDGMLNEAGVTVIRLTRENERLEARVRELEDALARILRAVDAGCWRDGVGLSFAAHPLVDDIRAALREGGNG